jgi:hypothetical protein
MSLRPAQAHPERSRSLNPAVAAALAAGVIAIYLMRLDRVAGLMVDDAWYVVLAKALAQGEGFRLISSAATPILPSVPPGFPALLSPVFLVTPAFPGNLVWLKLISVLAMFGAGAVCWFDFTRYRGVPPGPAAMLVAATVLTPSIVFLATSTVMAECVFTLAIIVATLMVERAARDESRSIGRPMAAGAAVAAATLVRSAGVALFAAAILYLLLARRWRHAAILGLTVLACLAPWQLYARAHEPTNEERLAHGGTIALSYSQLVAMKRPGDTRSGDSELLERVARGGRNLFGVLSRDIGGVVIPTFYRGPSESGQEVLSIVGGTAQIGSMGRGVAIAAVSLVLSAVMLAGCVRSRRDWFLLPALLVATSLMLIALVGSQTFRYVVPLTPYLLLFLWRGLGSGRAARIGLLCFLGFNLLDHAGYLHEKFTGTPAWLADAREVDEVLDWMATNVSEPEAVASTNPGLVYLRTGWKGVFSAFPEQNWQTWKSAGVRYVVALRSTELPPPSLGGRIIFQTKRRLWIVEM